jgi:molybdenum cofactor cytidylyltransferase
VLNVLDQAGVDESLVVTGGARREVDAAIGELVLTMPVRTVHNRSYSANEMTTSVQVGLSNLDEKVEAALIVLGDQPQMQTYVVQSLLDEYRITMASLVVPSYQMRRGHPWIVAQLLWAEIRNLTPSETLRVVLNRHADEIHYLSVNTPTVLQDLDTPDDYHTYSPTHGQ